jgi:hypothetical protein
MDISRWLRVDSRRLRKLTVPLVLTLQGVRLGLGVRAPDGPGVHR